LFPVGAGLKKKLAGVIVDISPEVFLCHPVRQVSGLIEALEVLTERAARRVKSVDMI
jgi:hypothetical protein